jgi:hypothetical protein
VSEGAKKILCRVIYEEKEWQMTVKFYVEFGKGKSQFPFNYSLMKFIRVLCQSPSILWSPDFYISLSSLRR